MFGGHPGQITGVGWKADQDYLFVACDDGSVSLWGVGTLFCSPPFVVCTFLILFLVLFEKKNNMSLQFLNHQLSTGILESCIHGPLAEEMIRNTTIYPKRKRLSTTKVKNGCVSAFAVKMDEHGRNNRNKNKTEI